MNNDIIKYPDLYSLNKLRNNLYSLYNTYRNYNTTNNKSFKFILNKFYKMAILIINRYDYIYTIINEYIKNIVNRKFKIGYNLHILSKEAYINMLYGIINEIESDKLLYNNLFISTNSLICHLIQNSRMLQTNIEMKLINVTNLFIQKLINVITKIKINILIL